jgi:hypothetical protein
MRSRISGNYMRARMPHVCNGAAKLRHVEMLKNDDGEWQSFLDKVRPAQREIGLDVGSYCKAMSRFQAAQRLALR